MPRGNITQGMAVQTILLVDDNQDVREVVAAVLSEPGYTVLVAADGYEALRILVEQPVDLLVADIAMPGITGFELARQAKLMRPHLHVIYLSGQVSEPDSSGGPTYGLLVAKPIRADELLAVVESELR
jgi:DNA-binding response OmpR family regulator